MHRNQYAFRLKIFLTLSWFLCSFTGFADHELDAKRAVFIKHISTHFAEQLTDPQKKNRKNLSQFGYNLSFFRFPIFPITDFINPNKFGFHSYGQPNRKEKNGSIYTCKGGFMDISHIRCAADWTVYLTFKIITDSHDFDLPTEAGTLELHFQNLDKLSLEDVASMTQKIAYERLLWHEIASWHYHPPNHLTSEQQSAFTPEDVYSNFLGTLIGNNIALRILNNLDTLSYSQIATEEIRKMVTSLNPMTTKKRSAQAYDIVDRNKQLKLPSAKRNTDIWYDSKIVFTDQRYMFKRDMDIGPTLEPWLVPQSKRLKCPAHPEAKILQVPQQTKAGFSFYNYYEFTISPDSSLFYAKSSGKELHHPFEPFSTRRMDTIVNQIKTEMENILLLGFEKRNRLDPVPFYTGLKKVFFR